MNLLNIENLNKAYSEQKLFDHASFSLQEGEKVGIIGINGTGKSTLLKIIAGRETPDEGTVTAAGHVVIGYLPQNPEFAPSRTALECVLDEHAAGEEEWVLEGDAKAMMMRLGIRDFAQPVGQLSGGQRKRLALVRVLLSAADILLLDEPTNHLDNEMADWLEDYLKKWKGSMIMVTHDRYFLDSVCNRIVEVDKGSLYSYQANYSGFLELKAQRADMEAAGERKRQSILRTELEWVRRGARARTTKQKARLKRFEELKDKQGPLQDPKASLSSISSRLGKTTVELCSVCKGYGDKRLICDFSYIFLKGDRIGFIGPNGCGKTTLLKMIAGLLAPDSGHMVVGQTVKIGYYAQEILTGKPQAESGPDSSGFSYMDPSQRVIDYVKDVAEYIRTTDGLMSASALLEKFLFPPQKQYGLVGKLSGGEKKRLNLLRVLAASPNVLLLDEPTNNLDIATLQILEDYLDRFEGIVVVVSHDRYFLDRTVKRIFAFEGDGKLTQYEGGYTDYFLRRAAEEEAAQTAKAAVPLKGMSASLEKGQRAHSPQKLRFTFKEKKDYETIEGDIEVLEEKLEGLKEAIEDAAHDFVKLGVLMEEKQRLEVELEEKMKRWMYLEELAERIENQ